MITFYRKIWRVTGMVKQDVYYEIKKMQRMGLSRNRISQKTGLNIRTVRKYWDMNEEEYRKYLSLNRFQEKEFDNFKDDVLEVYRINENMKLQVSAVFDYLEERKGKLPATENSLRNFVQYLVQSGELVFEENKRTYTQVPEMPYGKQMQVDFGEYLQRNGLKLYIMGAVLSSSRFKYAALQDRPFKTEDLIDHLLDCFDYIGGIPEEIVIDQDSIMVVSENAGDIIYTKQFDDFKSEMDFKMWVCRKADPESKGKIENFIKYIKYNFLSVREFEDIEAAKESLLKWLERRANGKISQATKKIPGIEINEERKHLRPVKASIYRKEKEMYREGRKVNDKCRIAVDASFYELPEKYRNGKVEIYKTEEKLFVFDPYTGKQITEYNVSIIPGQLVSDRSLVREMGRKASEWKEEILSYFSIEEWKEFARINFKEYDRYTRDQCREARKYFKDKGIDENTLKEAIKYCLENRTVSMKNLYDSYGYFQKQKETVIDQKLPSSIRSRILDAQPMKIAVEKPDAMVYEELISGIGGVL
jgi:hypothetical protein